MVMIVVNVSPYILLCNAPFICYHFCDSTEDHFFWQDPALAIVMDMASAFRVGSVIVKMGTLALTALLVMKIFFLKSCSICQLVILQVWPT